MDVKSLRWAFGICFIFKGSWRFYVGRSNFAVIWIDATLLQIEPGNIISLRILVSQNNTHQTNKMVIIIVSFNDYFPVTIYISTSAISTLQTIFCEPTRYFWSNMSLSFSITSSLHFRSLDFKDFVSACLKKSPGDRPTTEQLLAVSSCHFVFVSFTCFVNRCRQ